MKAGGALKGASPMKFRLRFLLSTTCLTLFTSISSIRAADALAQDYSVVFHNPDPEYYVEGCGLTKLEDGTLVAAVPVVPREQWSEERRLEHSVVHILRSTDSGKTWQAASDLPYYSAAPWVERGALYLFANKPGIGKARTADLLLLRSTVGGRSWAEPVSLFIGYYWNCDTGLV